MSPSVLWLPLWPHQDYSTTAAPRLERCISRKVRLRHDNMTLHCSQHTGIRYECLSRYSGGEGICCTSIHPSWHSTGILKGAEKKLNEYGIYPDPPSNVSDLVIEQVLKGRSGRICVPKSQASRTGVRNRPQWLQDILFGALSRNQNKFEFGREDTKLIA